MLQRLLVLLLLLQIVPDLFIYLRFIIRLTDRWWWRWLYWLPTTAFAIGLCYLAFFAGHSFANQYPQAIGWFSIAYFLFTAPKLLLTVCTVAGMALHRWFRLPRTPFICMGLTLAMACAGMIFYGSFVGKSRFEVKEVSFSSARLPESFDGYRIVQLSDIHIGSWQGDSGSIRRLVDIVNAQQPDLIVFTGDLVNHRAMELNGFEEILADLHAKDGVYSILGNHDYGPYYHWKSAMEAEENLRDLERRQAAMGWKLLNNTHIYLTQGNDSIALIGVENEGEPPFSQHGDLPTALQGTEGKFQLLLSHNPTHWRREVLPHSEVDLMLAGHTHAMQLKFGTYSPSVYIYPEWSGLYLEGGRGLYVNEGIGFVGLPFRFGAWPEITLLTLRRQTSH